MSPRQRNDALLAAVQSGTPADVRQLVAEGADINARDDSGWAAIHIAAWRRRADVLTAVLMTRGVVVECGGPYATLALHSACMAHPSLSVADADNPHCLAMLLDSDAFDVNAVNDNGDTPLLLAIAGRCSRIALRLLLVPDVQVVPMPMLAGGPGTAVDPHELARAMGLTAVADAIARVKVRAAAS
jgi:ankyrin repeat protein